MSYLQKQTLIILVNVPNRKVTNFSETKKSQRKNCYEEFLVRVAVSRTQLGWVLG